jgi:hypothetical protein
MQENKGRYAIITPFTGWIRRKKEGFDNPKMFCFAY